jgi:hypothetical protein
MEPKRTIILGKKDENGIFLKPEVTVVPPQTPDPEVSLDDIGRRILLSMDRATKTLLSLISGGRVDIDTINALKSCASMYKDMRKDEKDLIDSLSDEELNKLSKK